MTLRATAAVMGHTVASAKISLSYTNLVLVCHPRNNGGDGGAKPSYPGMRTRELIKPFFII